MAPVGPIEWNGIVARLHGAVDRTNADVVFDEITRHGPCVIDLHDVTFVDRFGLAVLLELDSEHECTVVNPSSPVTRLLNLVGVTFLIGGRAERGPEVATPQGGYDENRFRHSTTGPRCRRSIVKRFHHTSGPAPPRR